VAWIKAQQGDLLGAINQMQALVDKDRDYEWGWRQLADWHRERGANRYYLEASLELIRVAPNNSWYLCNLGHAQLLNEDREAATQAFRRAFELVPGLEFAGRNLFLLQLDALDFHGAALTVNEMRRTVSPGAVLAMQIKLASAQNDATTMDQNLGDLFRMADVPESDLTDAANSAYARWAALTNRHLGEALDDTETHPVVGDLWIRAFARDRHWRACEKRIASLDPDREITRRAQMALLECMVEAEETSRLRRYVSKHREQLHADTRLWGATLNALAMLRRWSVLVKWAGTLKGREGIEPWMLANLATGLRALGRFDEAKKANERSFMLPADHSSREQALWLALEEALQDETRVAQTWLAQFPEAQFDERERFLFGLARGVLELQHEDQAGGMDRFKSSGAILAEARANCPDFGNDVVLRRALRRCLRHVARKRGGVRGALWYVKWLEG
jgi:tetratricopeptide (TPR) repeat protein